MDNTGIHITERRGSKNLRSKRRGEHVNITARDISGSRSQWSDAEISLIKFSPVILIVRKLQKFSGYFFAAPLYFQKPQIHVDTGNIFFI